jgi:hypothetical protein
LVMMSASAQWSQSSSSPILDGLIREVFADVNVLGAFAASDDIVSHSMHAVLSSYTVVGPS